MTTLECQPFARSGDLSLTLPDTPSRGIGSVILNPSSAELIDGVQIKRIDLWPDDRGYFLEIQRLGKDLAAHFPAETTQISAALSYPGAIKAFHYHLLIPPGVGHGYKVVGLEPALLVYMTDRCYNPADEGRIAYNDPQVGYDWELQHK